MPRSTARFLAVVIGFSVLVACSAPAGPLGPVTVKATLNAEPGSEAAVAAFYVMHDSSLVLASQASSVNSPTPGTYVGPASPVDADDTVHLVLPDPNDLPEAVLATADSFVRVISIAPEVCPTTASDPSTKVSMIILSPLLSYPTPFVLTGDGFASSYTTDTKLDFTVNEEQLFHLRFVTWLYAEDAVDVKTAPGGCVNGTAPTVEVDLELLKGWNQVAWSMQDGGSGDPPTFTLGNGSDVDPIYISYTAVRKP